MKTNEIYTAYVSWITGGKRRPILVVKDKIDTIRFYKITTKYQKKSSRIKANYYKMHDWKEEGLNKQSYIDTGRIEEMPKKGMVFHHVGRLSIAETEMLAQFINHKN